MNSQDETPPAVYISSLDDYQAAAQRTASPTPALHLTSEDAKILRAAIGLAGEAGEALEIVKKWLFHGHDLDMAALKKEVGDAGWYWADFSAALGECLSETASANIAKLRARYPEGFSTTESQKRCVCGHHLDDHGADLCTQCHVCDGTGYQQVAS